MSTTLSNIAQLTLVRLLAPGAQAPTPAKIKKDLEPFFQQRLAGAAWSDAVEDALRQLGEQGQVGVKPLALTDTGRRRALDFLGLAELPPRTRWDNIKNTLLVTRALGTAELTPEQRKRLATADGLRAALLNRTHGLGLSEAPTLTQALNALAWKQLGVTSTAKFTVAAVLAHAFALECKPNSKKVGELLPAKSVEARKSGAAELRLAAVRRWLDADQATAPPRAAPVVDESFNLAGFAEAVREAARTAPTGRFGDHKVFIAHVWRWLHEQRAFPAMTEAEFKRRLVEANHAGLLALSRADMVEAMAAEDVRASEVPYLNATFHFVQV